MTNYKKYKHKETGETIEAALTKLYIVDNNDVVTNKGNQIVLGNLGAMMKIKGESQADVYWKCYTFNEQYEEIQ